MAERVSIVLAAYEESRSISAVVTQCLEYGSEVVVVDDGSRDDTASTAASAGARVFRLSENRGKGAALRRGAIEARGEQLVFLDADGQDDPADIPALLAALDDDVDLVVGSRFLGSFETGAITPLHTWGNRGLTRLVNTLFDSRLTDTQAGFRAVRRAAFLEAELDAAGFDVEVDLLLDILLRRGRIVEVPVTRRARQHGSSHLRTVRDGARILLRILRKRLRRPRSRGA